MLDLILGIIIIVIIIIFGGKSLSDYFIKKKIKKCVELLKQENKEFKLNLSTLEEENKKLSEIKDEFQKELIDLKGICTLVGEINEESYEKIKALYIKHKQIVNLEIKTISLKILLDLDKNSDYELSKSEKEYAKKKLHLLFKNADISIIPDQHFNDFYKLQESIENLVRDNLNNM